MTTRIKLNQLKGFFYIVLCIVVLFYSCVANAQQVKRTQTRFYQGFESSYGARLFKVKSNINQIDALPVITEGGSAGLIAGSKIVRTKITASFFYSASSVKQTVDAFELDVSTILYPINKLRSNKRTVPYITSGINYNKLKFASGYLDNDGKKRNRSITSDEYIGRLHQFNIISGVGIEHSLMEKFDFLHLFLEGKASIPIQTDTRSVAFRSTNTTAQLVINFGVRFGACR